MIAVSLAWGARYREHVAAWTKSVEAAGLIPRVLELLEEPASRDEVWKLRPSMIAQALEESGEDVLHLDIDARVCEAPSLPSGFDLAAYASRPGILEPGVSFWRQGEAASRVLAAWRHYLDAGRNDALALGLAAAEQLCKIYLLPPEMCWVEKWGMRERFGNRKPIIRVLAGSSGGD
jgi:hypothetical protein